VMVAVNVSLPDERIIRGRLSALAFLVRTISDSDPSLLLIGEAIAAARDERTGYSGLLSTVVARADQILPGGSLH
jgi:uroporphyrin-III C-methyltransferase